MGTKATVSLAVVNLIMLVVMVGGLLWYVRMRQNTDLGHFLDVNVRLNAIIERLDSMEKKIDSLHKPEVSVAPGTASAKGK